LRSWPCSHRVMLQDRPAPPPPEPAVWAPASSASLTSDSPVEVGPAVARIDSMVGVARAGRDSLSGGGFTGLGLSALATAFGAALGLGSGTGGAGGSGGGGGVNSCTM